MANSEIESNNTRATANSLPLGISIAGALSSSSDVDYYAVAINSSGVLHINFDRPNNILSGYYSLRLEDASGTVLSTFTDSVDPQIFLASVFQAGTYYVRVSNHSGSSYYSNPYTLSVTEATSYPEDIAALVATAGTVTAGSSISGNIGVAGEHDYFRVQLVAGTTYQFDLKGSSSGGGTLGDPSLMLHNAQGTVLRYDDNGGRPYSSPASTVTDAQIVFTPQESGAYFLDAGGIAVSTGTYQLTATTLSPDYYIQDILHQPNVRWNGSSPLRTAVNVTYSFPATLPSDFSSGVSNFQPFTEAQKTAARQVLANISTYANITFTEVSGSAGQIRFATTNQGGDSAGQTDWHSLNGAVLTRADVALANDQSSNTSPTSGTYGYETLIHEIEHALGLKHPGNYNVGGGGNEPPYLPTSQDASQFTVMTYNNATQGYDKSSMVFDVAALQYYYGTNMATQTGNDNYTFSTGAIYTIWDAGGTDILDASNWTTSVTLDLNPGTVSYAGYLDGSQVLQPCVGIAFGCTIENAKGGSADDKLLGGSGDNVLSGGAGNDRLEGAAGNDTLDGGTGADTMIGGVGNDSYIVDNSGDIVTENAGEGTDTVNTSINYTLPANIENLILTGSLAINGYGNELDNTITGNDGNNILSGGAGNDTLTGGAGNDTLDGGSGADAAIFSGAYSKALITYLSASSSFAISTASGGADTVSGVETFRFDDQSVAASSLVTTTAITGTSGNDALRGSAGNDAIDGGAGLDTLIYSGSRSNFTITPSGNNYIIADNTGAEGADTLTNVERLVFSNARVALDIEGAAGQTYRLYQAAFNRTPDISGLSNWVNAMDNGMTLTQEADAFIQSAEFKLRYGTNPINADFITVLYDNVLHRVPDSGGFANWMNALTVETRAQVLVGFSESAENHINVIGVIQDGITLL